MERYKWGEKKGLLEDKMHTLTSVFLKYHMKNDLIVPDGHRVPKLRMQAYGLSLWKGLRNVSGQIEEHEGDLLIQSRKMFLNKKSTGRDIFLAAYFYPGLFSNVVWEKKIMQILKTDWLGFGIQDGKHSCLWLNNLAAIVMHQVNKDMFKDYISAIVEFSSQDLMEGNIAGHSSVSVSLNGKHASGVSVGAAGMFIELLHELF